MQCTSQESFQQMIPIKLGDGISQTSIGRLNFCNLAVIFKTFNAEIAEIMPSDPSNIPASTTVSYSKNEAPSTRVSTCYTFVNMSNGKCKMEIILKLRWVWSITKWEPINKASALGFIPSTRPCTLPIWSIHLEISSSVNLVYETPTQQKKMEC